MHTKNEALLGRAVEQAEALATAGKWREASEAYAKALAMGASGFLVHYNYGTVLSHCGSHGGACDQLCAALRCDPESLDALNNLAASNLKLGNACAAEVASRSILAKAPRHHIALTTLGMALCDQGKLAKGIACLRQALLLDPGYKVARDNLLYNLNYVATDGEALAKEYRKLCSILVPIAPKPIPDVRQRRIRVGYVSSDFRNHSVAHFIGGILDSHDRSAFEVTCYSATHSPDQLTQGFAQITEHFLDIAAMGDREAAAQIEADGIDILVDLGGRTSGNRLGIFESRPAPVQATYLGYPSTTGCSFMDYRLVDEVTDPPGSSAFTSETLVRLPVPFLTYAPYHAFPDVVPPPLCTDGSVTFGSFNHSSKISEPCIDVWGRLLSEVPDSRLFLKARAFSDEAVCDYFREQFSIRGIEGARLVFSGLLKNPREHLASYGHIDISLDTFPYNGTTTTCESLWMGVPVVSLTGTLHAGRVGRSILTSVGLSRFAVDSADAYIALAKGLAVNRDGLSELRRVLRSATAKSRLCDRKQFTRNLELAYREMVSAPDLSIRFAGQPRSNP
jgi:protein O-GlcNAc transferase